MDVYIHMMSISNMTGCYSAQCQNTEPEVAVRDYYKGIPVWYLYDYVKSQYVSFNFIKRIWKFMNII